MFTFKFWMETHTRGLEDRSPRWGVGKERGLRSDVDGAAPEGKGGQLGGGAPNGGGGGGGVGGHRVRTDAECGLVCLHWKARVETGPRRMSSSVTIHKNK